MRRRSVDVRMAVPFRPTWHAPRVMNGHLIEGKCVEARSGCRIGVVGGIQGVRERARTAGFTRIHPGPPPITRDATEPPQSITGDKAHRRYRSAGHAIRRRTSPTIPVSRPYDQAGNPTDDTGRAIRRNLAKPGDGLSHPAPAGVLHAHVPGLTFPVSCSRSHVPGLTFPVSCSRSHVPGLMFPVSRSPSHVPRLTFPVSRSPSHVPRSRTRRRRALREWAGARSSHWIRWA